MRLTSFTALKALETFAANLYYHHLMFQAHHSQLWQRRKTVLAIGMSLTLLLAFIFPATTARAQAQKSSQALPIFDVNLTEYNFGEVFVGEELLKIFTARNLGAAPLQLAESPIVTGTPTVGLYREAPLEARPSLSARAKPAASFIGAAPYT